MDSQILGLDPETQTATDPQAQLKYMIAVAQARINAGASWFTWIGGLSVVNVLILIFRIPLHFPVGLGITEAIVELSASRGAFGVGIGFLITLAAASLFVLMGHFTKQGRKWALVVGIVFYALDALLVLIAQVWLMLAFHVFALFMLFRIFSSLNLYARVKEQAVAQGLMAPQL